MKIQEIRRIAKGMGINSFGATKIDLIRRIQRTEGNSDCYATPSVSTCGQSGCAWRDDCATANEGDPQSRGRQTRH